MEGPRDLKKQGSIPWSWQTLSALQHMWQSLQLNYEHYMTILEEAREHCIWEKIPPSRPYGTEANMLEHVMIGNNKGVVGFTNVRLKVQLFAELMEQKLRSNDWKGGFHDMSVEDVLHRMREEAMELLAEGMSESALDEAIDVANFAAVGFSKIEGKQRNQ